jgi:hypothetical protein
MVQSKFFCCGGLKWGEKSVLLSNPLTKHEFNFSECALWLRCGFSHRGERANTPREALSGKQIFSLRIAAPLREGTIVSLLRLIAPFGLPGRLVILRKKPGAKSR